MLADPKPGTVAYTARIYANYILCPNRLQYPDQVCDIRSTDWLYYPYDEDSTIENLLNVLNLTNLFQKTGIYRHHTLYGHMLY